MYEWFNQTIPLMNTDGVKDMVSLRVSSTSTGVDLRTLFGNRTNIPTGAGPDIQPPSGMPNVDGGHFYTIKADAASAALPSGPQNPWRAYVGMFANVRTVDEAAVGVGTGVCWPILDGESLRARMFPAVRDRASGTSSGFGGATLFSAPVLNFKCPAGAGTGWLRIYRSSLGEGQDPGTAWPAPGVRF